MQKKSTYKVNAEKLRGLAEARCLSWARLARLADISAATVLSVAAGRRNASLNTVRKLAAALEVEPAELLAVSDQRQRA